MNQNLYVNKRQTMTQSKQECVLNYIRVFAMLGIIGDHYLQSTGIPILSNTGLWMGGGISYDVLRPVSLFVRNEMG